MATERKKSFFREPSAAEIKKRNKVEVSPFELDDVLDSLDEDFILVRGVLVPKKYG